VTGVALHVDQLSFPAPGGIGTYLRNLVPALGRQDPSLEIVPFRSRFEGDPPDEPALAHLPLEELNGSIRSLYPRWALTARPWLPERVRRLDLVHATNPAAVPPAAPGQRLVVTVHDLAFLVLPGTFPRAWRWLYRVGLRAAVRRADAIVTPSRSTAEDLLSRTRVDPEKVFVTPLAASLSLGVDDPDAVLARLKVPPPYLLFVGTLEPRKNLLRLVRAYRRVAQDGIPHALVLAGPLGWQGDRLLREIALRGPGEIVLTGPLSDDELDALYRGADAFVYPSLYEGFGLPVVEAMSRGLPSVVSTSSSLPEVAGDAALAVNPRSVRELASAIATIATDVAMAERLAAKARARAERFSWDETARRTLEMYERLLEAK
jgi:glycosyltransferase involved in cell wall biosynthesis